MARIRTIKPEFFTSEDIVEMSPLTRLLYIALWCEADREGRMVWKPITFKLRYFPGDDCDIFAMCDALLTGGLLVVYASEGVDYAYIPTFHAHQHLNPRESVSQLPEPCTETRISGSRASRVPHASPTRADATVTHREEGKGREGKGNPIEVINLVEVKGDGSSSDRVRKQSPPSNGAGVSFRKKGIGGMMRFGDIETEDTGEGVPPERDWDTTDERMAQIARLKGVSR